MCSISRSVIVGIFCTILKIQSTESGDDDCIKETFHERQRDYIWTEWMSLNVADNDMFYGVDLLLTKYPGCELTSTNQIQYRVKYLPFLGNSRTNHPEFMPRKGIYCKNEKNNNVQCNDYEIRFHCVSNDPIPDLYWDLSGKESYQSMDFKECTTSKSRQIFATNGTYAAPVHGNFYLRESFPGSENMCALHTNGSTIIDFGDFNGACVSRLSSCGNGFTISFWLIAARSGPILNSPDSRGSTKDVFGISLSNGTLTAYLQSCDHIVKVSLNDSLPSDWVHFVITFHPYNQSQIQIFINGGEKHSIKKESYIVTDGLSISSVSGANKSGLNERRDYGLSNLKIFNHKLTTNEVERLYFTENNPSSIKVLRLRDISNNSDSINLQCIVKTCKNPTVNWLYYPHGSTVPNPTSSTLTGKTGRKSRCHIEYVLQGKRQTAGYFVCEVRIDGGSYDYKLIEVSNSTSTTASDGDALSGTSQSDVTTPETDIDGLLYFIDGIPSSCQEIVRNEIDTFKQLTFEQFIVQRMKPTDVDYQFEHDLWRSRRKKNRRKTDKDERKLTGKVFLPILNLKGNITVAVAYGRVDTKEYHVNLTKSRKHIEGTIDDGILFIWVFDEENEISAEVDFNVPKTEAKQKGHDNHYCAYWDEEISTWSTRGCKTNDDIGSVSCRCDHTTSFAIILQVVDVEVPHWLKLQSKLLGSVSICCLLLTICIFCKLRPAKNYRIIIHGNLAAALGFAQLVFMLTSDATQFQTVCQMGAVLSHYFFTAFLAWMLIEGYLLYQKSVTPTKNPPRIKVLAFIGWVFPLIGVGISFSAQQNAYGATFSCWLNSRVLKWMFVSQVITVVSINALVLIVVMKTFASLKVNVNKSEFERTKSNTRALCALIPVLGLTWTFGLLAIDTTPEMSIRKIIFMILFDITNCLQGVFILIFHCLKNREIQKEFEVRKKIARSRRSSTRSSSSNNHIIRCRTETGDLLYIPGDLIEKSSPRHSPSGEFEPKFESVTSPERSSKSDTTFSF